LKLMLRVRFDQAVRAFDKQSFHFVGNGISGRVEHTQFGPKLDCLAGEIAPAKDRRLEIDIGKKCVDVLGERRSESASSTSLAKSVWCPQS
jgi:hypothetical protein